MVFAPSVRADDAYDAAVRNLERTVAPQRDGSHLVRLAALRQLRDANLRPLFEHLVHADDWQMQVHAVLGLAELSPNSALDPGPIPDLGPVAQEAVIANAIDLDLLDADAMRSLLVTGRLEPVPHMLLMGELLLLGETAEEGQLREWAANDDLRLAAMASCLLAKLGDVEPLAAYADRLAELAAAQRTQNLLLALEMVRQYKVEPAADWVASLLNEDEHSEVVYRGVLTLIELDRGRGLQAWREQIRNSSSHSLKVRYALLLLACDASIPAETFATLDDDDDRLIDTLVQLGRAKDGQGDLAAAYINLFSLGHRRSVDWAMTSLKSIGPETSQPVYGFLIDRLAEDERPDQAHIDLAVRATADLGKLQLDSVLERLRSAEDDGLTQQAILLGLFDVDDPRVGQAAAELRRIGTGRADSLALLLMAKHLPSLTPADLEGLGLIAAGGGRVSEALETQAGWLYLKHTGRTDVVLSTILSGD